MSAFTRGALEAAAWRYVHGFCPPGVGMAELERENADRREQRTSEKSARHLLRTPAMKMGVSKELARRHPARMGVKFSAPDAAKCCFPHLVRRAAEDWHPAAFGCRGDRI